MQFLRFLILGTASTLATYILFILLSFRLEAWLAYTISYAVGLIVGTVLSINWVFGSRLSWKSFAWLSCIYLSSYLVGRILVHIIDPSNLETMLWTSLVVALTTIPLNFLGGRMVASRIQSGSKKLV
jgi:putative flippase GtrA